MNKTLVGAVLIAVLIGLGGGYAFGYVIYQPQLQSLQDDLDSLSGQLHDLTGDMTSVQNQMGSYSSEIVGLQNQLTSLNNRILELNSTLLTLQNQLSPLQTQVTSLQSQLSSLNAKLADLNSTLTQIENRSWHLVQAISGSTDTVTGTFQLRGEEIRMMWTAEGLSASSWLSIALRFSNGTLYSYYGSSGIWTAINVDEELTQSGLYYLDVMVLETDYVIAIWDYY
jgi:prefoldin subunit 5